MLTNWGLRGGRSGKRARKATARQVSVISDGASARVEPTATRHVKGYRTADGRFVSQGERVAAAQARVVADRRRGQSTPAWIAELAASSSVPSDVGAPQMTSAKSPR